MRKTIAFAFASCLGLSSISIPAMAMPVGPLNGAAAMVTEVAQGCGPGMHRGPYGHCRPMFSCPWGWHPGPYGLHCFRN